MVGNTRRGRLNGADERKRAAERLRELVANGEGGFNPLGVTPGQMLLAGFEPSEPKLADMLDRLEEDFFKSQAKFKVRLNDSYLLRGQPDPTGTLPEGSVYVVLEGKDLPYIQPCDAPSNGAEAQQQPQPSQPPPMEVLVYKAPGCHVGDVRKMRLESTPELYQLLSAQAGRRRHAPCERTRAGGRSPRLARTGSCYAGTTRSSSRRAARVRRRTRCRAPTTTATTSPSSPTRRGRDAR